MILGGYILIRPDGGPVYGYCGTVTVYPKRDRASLARADLGGRPACAELRILADVAQPPASPDCLPGRQAGRPPAEGKEASP